jgi:putative redox protein
MSGQIEEVKVNLINQKVKFKGESKSNPDAPVFFDYVPPVGDGEGYNGLELLLMSLSGCSATAVVFLLRKMGKTVSGFEVNAKGVKTEQPPLKFEKIFLEFVLKSNDAKDADMQRAMKLAEESVCPVWQMIKNNVEVVAGYKIIP